MGHVSNHKVHKQWKSPVGQHQRHFASSDLSVRYQLQDPSAMAHILRAGMGNGTGQTNWNSKKSQLEFMDSLWGNLALKKWEDWYDVSMDTMVKFGGYNLLAKHGKSTVNLITATYPQYPWEIWKFSKVPVGYWENLDHHLQFVNWLAEELHIQSVDEWYRVTVEDVRRKGGRAMLAMYEDSTSNMLASIYRDTEWQPWRFERVPLDYWKKRSNHANFLKDVQKELGITHWKQWYHVSSTQLGRLGGWSLVRMYQGVAPLVTSVFPEHPWKMWLFEVVPPTYWEDPLHQLEFIGWAAKMLHIENMHGWYEVTGRQIADLGGKHLLKKHGSLSQLLMNLYPDHAWQPWRFVRVPLGYWDNVENLERYFVDLAQILGKRSQRDWETTLHHSTFPYKGKTLLKLYGSTSNSLKLAFPEVQWQPSHRISHGQRHLKEVVSQFCLLVGGTAMKDELQENYKHPDLLYAKSNLPAELDLYIPSLALAFEYQGTQHVEQICRGDVENQKRRDSEKKRLCRDHGISLICIHHQWSGLLEDLVATVSHYAPEKLRHVTVPLGGKLIPSKPPKGKPRRNSPGEPQFMLPKKYSGDLDPTNWWITEKYDGFRAMWIGKEGYFVTKGGIVIDPPAFIQKQLPDCDLDGEIWLGRGRGDEVRRRLLPRPSGPEDWKDVKFMIFDLKPEQDHTELVFEERIAIAKRKLTELEKMGEKLSNVELVSMERCTGHSHLHAHLASVLDQGGEGLVIRQPRSTYDGGLRSKSVLKIKQKYFAWALVTKITQAEDVDIHQGSEYFTITCLSPHGVQFTLRKQPAKPLMDSLLQAYADTQHPVITIQYYGLSHNQQPLFATCVQLHKDMRWEKIIWYHVETSQKFNALVTCYSCRQTIGKSSLRITTTTIRKCHVGSYIPCNLSFHPTSSCLTDNVYHEMAGGKRHNTVIPFDGVVALNANSKLLPEHQKQLQLLEESGIRVALQRPFPMHDETTENTLADIIQLMNSHGNVVDVNKCKFQWNKNSSVKSLLASIKQDSQGVARIFPEWKLSTNSLLYSSNPSLGKIPKEIRREILLPNEGHTFLSVDFDQCQMRILANTLGSSSQLVAWLLDGEDIPTLAASRILQKGKQEVSKEERKLFKHMIYGIFVGKGRNKLMKEMEGIDTFHVENVHNQLRALFANELKYKEELIIQARRNGFLCTLVGNRVNIRPGETNDVIWDHMIQRAGNELILKSLMFMWSKLRSGGLFERAGIAWTLSDEIVFEVKENDRNTAKRFIHSSVEAISSMYNLSVPMVPKVTDLQHTRKVQLNGQSKSTTT